MSADYPVAHELFGEIWRALDGDEAWRRMDARGLGQLAPAHLAPRRDRGRRHGDLRPYRLRGSLVSFADDRKWPNPQQLPEWAILGSNQ